MFIIQQIMRLEVSQLDFRMFSVKKVSLEGQLVCNLELHPPRVGEGNPNYFSINWPTQVSIDEGLSVIRDSYLGLKRRFIEPRSLLPVERAYPLGREAHDATGIVYYSGPVQFLLDGHIDPMAVGMDIFMNPTSFRSTQGEENPLEWIRVNSEYFEYFFSGGISEGRYFSGLGIEFMGPDELMDLYRRTSAIGLNDENFGDLKGIISKSLAHLPKLEERVD